MQSATSIAPFYTASGAVSLSTIGAGSNDGPVDRQIIKPAGATVRAAFLMAASVPESATPADGDVTINGTPVDFDESTVVTSGIDSTNIRGDVTSIVAPIIDSAGAGPVTLVLNEPNDTDAIDGEVLTVVFNDPTVGANNSVSLLYGAQQPTGDQFNVLLSQPVDLRDTNLALNLSLGISYSYQGDADQAVDQYSQIDVNGQRLTTSAGGSDDGGSDDGALITVGGVGDSTANPAQPDATPSECDVAPPRCDDELYSLKPFVQQGDTRIAVDTLNPSNDDNIFFASLEFRGTSAAVGEGVVLSPQTDTQPVDGNHTSTATVQDNDGNPVPNKTVTFTVTAGPNQGLSRTTVTNDAGQATFTYSSHTAGDDTVVASFTDDAGATKTSNSTTVTWNATSSGPVAHDDGPYTATCGEQLQVSASNGLLANDTPANSGLTVAPSSVTQPDHGSVTVSSDGSFVYTPGDSDSDCGVSTTFHYTARQGETDSNAATVTINIGTASEADLSIAKTGPTSVGAGASIEYTIEVSNGGPDSATNVVVNDPLPGNTTFLTASNGCTHSSSEDGPGVVTCTANTVSVETPVTFTVDVTAPNEGTVTNTASVSSSTADPNGHNNSSTVVTAVGSTTTPPPPPPPASETPTTTPPTSEPPTTEPPTTTPPTTSTPPTSTPPTTQPVTQPPVTQPPVTQPPVTQPPVTQPATGNPAPPVVPTEVPTTTTPSVQPTQPSVPVTNPPASSAKDALTLTAPSVIPGGALRATGSGCAPGTDVQLSVAGRAAGKGTTDGQGRFDVPVSTTGLSVGVYTVTATCGDRQLVAPVSLVYVTSNSNAPTAQALVVAAALAFFVLLLSLLVRRPTS